MIPSPPTLDIKRFADPFSILERRTKHLPTNDYSYKLIGASGGYGLDVAFNGEPEVNEAEMSIVLPFGDGSNRDGVGDVLEIGGIDLSRHRRNPVCLLEHSKQCPLPIGLAENPETKEYTVFLDVENKKAKAKVWMYRGKNLEGVDNAKQNEHALLCDQVFDLWAKKYLRGGSIGYACIEADHLQPNYQTGTPQGLWLKRVLMLECSVVCMPANPLTTTKSLWTSEQYGQWEEGIRRTLSAGKLCGKPISGYLMKSLSGALPMSTKTAVGFAGTKGLKVTVEQYRDMISALQQAFSSLTGAQKEERPREAEWVKRTARELMNAECPRASTSDKQKAERWIDTTASWLIRNGLEGIKNLPFGTPSLDHAVQDNELEAATTGGLGAEQVARNIIGTSDQFIDEKLKEKDPNPAVRLKRLRGKYGCKALTAVSEAINKLLKQNKNGYVFSTYSRVISQQTVPDKTSCGGTYYAVIGGNVSRHSYDHEHGGWSETPLNKKTIDNKYTKGLRGKYGKKSQGNTAYRQGNEAAGQGKPKTANPYDSVKQEQQADDWDDGWLEWHKERDGHYFGRKGWSGAGNLKWNVTQDRGKWYLTNGGLEGIQGNPFGSMQEAQREADRLNTRDDVSVGDEGVVRMGQPNPIRAKVVKKEGRKIFVELLEQGGPTMPKGSKIWANSFEKKSLDENDSTSEAKEYGKQDAKWGVSRTQCPYKRADLQRAWLEGFNEETRGMLGQDKGFLGKALYDPMYEQEHAKVYKEWKDALTEAYKLPKNKITRAVNAATDIYNRWLREHKTKKPDPITHTGEMWRPPNGTKSLSNDFHKGIKDLRQKYKTAKGLRRRLKKSSPGSSIVHVSNKDLDAVGEAAKGGGLEMTHMGEKGGVCKLKFVGADDQIHKIASQYGEADA